MVSLLGGGRAPHATSGGPGLREAFVVWVAWGVVGITVWVTYARLPADELYNVSGTGVLAGAGRTLVYLDWPVALAAVALSVVAAERLLAGPLTPAGRNATVAAAAVAIGLCATIGLPGVLDPNDLDARPANVPAAAGVLLALLLTFAALRVRGWGRWERLARGDLIALAVAPVAVVLSIPWILAGIGVQTSEAVHLGNHEGIDGLLLAATGVALRRPLRRMRRTPLRPLLGAYLALIATYGLAVAADDFWIEQLQRRGAVSHGLPYVLKPGPRPAWAALLAVACVGYALAFRVGNEPGSSTARR
jgi:hypothetical protein